MPYPSTNNGLPVYDVTLSPFSTSMYTAMGNGDTSTAQQTANMKAINAAIAAILASNAPGILYFPPYPRCMLRARMVTRYQTAFHLWVQLLLFLATTS